MHCSPTVHRAAPCPRAAMPTPTELCACPRACPPAHPMVFLDSVMAIWRPSPSPSITQKHAAGRRVVWGAQERRGSDRCTRASDAAVLQRAIRCASRAVHTHGIYIHARNCNADASHSLLTSISPASSKPPCSSGCPLTLTLRRLQPCMHACMSPCAAVLACAQPAWRARLG